MRLQLSARILKRTNAHSVSGFDDFLKSESMFDEVHARALKHARAEQINDGVDLQALSNSVKTTNENYQNGKELHVKNR